MVRCFKDVSFWRQALATFAAAIGMFSWGNLIGWSNATDVQLQNNVTGFGMDDEEQSWVGSTVGFGGILGSIIAGKLMDLMGRNASLICAYSISLIGWIVISCASSVWIICVGRFICGFAAATTALTASVYVGEIVSSKHRGLFGCSLAFAQSIGLQYVIIVGELTPNWRITTVLCILPIIMGIIILFLVPESPYFMAWKSGDINDARKSLNWILDNQADKVELSMEDIREYLQSMGKTEVKVELPCYANKAYQYEQESQSSFQGSLEIQAKKSSTNLSLNEMEDMDEEKPRRRIKLFDVKMVLIGSTAMMFSKTCGDPALDYYMVDIFNFTGMKLKASWATIIVRMAEILSTGLSLYLTDRMGRKILLLSSAFGMAVAMAILGASFTIMDEHKDMSTESLSYIPLASMILFYLVSPIGFNAVIFVLLGELYSPSIKGVATSIATVVWWLSEFLTAKLFFQWNNHLGRAGTFYLYACTSIVAIIFVQCFIIETKNKTLAEIQELYKQKIPIERRRICNFS